jgi:hypothetical protein
MSRRRSAFACFGSPARTTSSSWSATAARLAASGVVGACGASRAARARSLPAQVREARLERGYARLESLRVEIARLERGVVAVERALRAPDFFGERASLFFERRTVCLLLFGCGVDRVSDDVAVSVERSELTDDGGLELVARDALAIAALCRGDVAANVVADVATPRGVPVAANPLLEPKRRPPKAEDF